MRLQQVPGLALFLIISLVLAGHPAHGKPKKKSKEPTAAKEASKEKVKKKKAKKGKAKKAEAKAEEFKVEETKKEAEEKPEAMKETAKKSTDEAGEILGKALALYKEGKYDEAVELFKQANELDPNPSAYYNIARCYDKSSKFEQAHDYYQKYLDTGDQIKVKEAQEALKRIEDMPLILKVLSTPDGADVLVEGSGVEAQKTPVLFETKAGKHTVLVKKEGYEDVEREVEILYGGEGRVEVVLTAEKALEKPVAVEPVGGAGAGRKKVPFSFRLAAGATVSTTKYVGSYIDASLGFLFRIKGGMVGLGADNLIFSNSYLLAAYPAGGYQVKVWKYLLMEFLAGFGVAYLNSFSDSGDGEGNVLIEKGSHWDLVAHAEIRMAFKAGPVLVLLVPVHANILIGVGSIDPAPLAQFAFLAGIGYDL